MTIIQTYPSNKKFDLINCTPDDIDIRDIAHSLALINRFGGHIPEPLSVAQHSVQASFLAWNYDVDPMSMLLHDAAEAYVGDIVKPIKEYLGIRFSRLEDHVAYCIAVKYHTTWPMTAAMKRCDMDLLETEFRDIKGPRVEGIKAYGTPIAGLTIDCWSWRTAKASFLERFAELGGTP